MEKNCIHCSAQISTERLEAIPETTTCVKCSTVSRVKGFTTWDNKTHDLIICDEKELEWLEDLSRVDGRLSRLK